MDSSPFDDLTGIYEALVDWPKRLAGEEPFYRRLFERVGVRSVLDVACGTGRHAAMFHSWGLRVEGADVSPGMIEHARAAFGEPDGLRWIVRGFDEPAGQDEPFDAAVCVGNSLSLAPDPATAKRAVAQMLAAVRPGGVAVVHVLNLWRLPDGPCIWQKCTEASLAEGKTLILKGVHRCGRRGYVDVVAALLGSGGERHVESVPLVGLEASDLEGAASEAGASRVRSFGDYRGSPYRRDESVDLIMVAEK